MAVRVLAVAQAIKLAWPDFAEPGKVFGMEDNPQTLAPGRRR
jgi:hypothetical protein